MNWIKKNSCKLSWFVFLCFFLSVLCITSIRMFPGQWVYLFRIWYIAVASIWLFFAASAFILIVKIQKCNQLLKEWRALE